MHVTHATRSRLIKLGALCTVIVTLGGCTQLTDSGTPFDVTTGNANGAVLYGVWEGNSQTASTVTALPRLELRADHIRYAMRCTSVTGTVVTPSMALDAQVDDTVLRVLVSGQQVQVLDNVQCGVVLSAGLVPACTDDASKAGTCFDHASKKFILYQSGTPRVFQKVAD